MRVLKEPNTLVSFEMRLRISSSSEREEEMIDPRQRNMSWCLTVLNALMKSTKTTKVSRPCSFRSWSAVSRGGWYQCSLYFGDSHIKLPGHHHERGDSYGSL